MAYTDVEVYEVWKKCDVFQLVLYYERKAIKTEMILCEKCYRKRLTKITNQCKDGRL